MKKRISLFVIMIFTFVCVITLAACNTDGGKDTGDESDWSEWTVTVAATCEKAGTETRVSRTNSTVVETRPIAAHGHDWDEGKITTAPSCLIAGVETRVCKECGNDDMLRIEPLGHDWNDWEILTAPTCLTAGSAVKVCENDGTHTETSVIPALGHDWSDWVTMIAPTCTATGVEMKTCKNDNNHFDVRTVPALEHDWNDWVVTTAPTCETTGIETKFCKNCSAHTETRSVTALGHDWSDWVVTAAPTESTDGTETRFCRNNKTHFETNTLYATGTAGLRYTQISKDGCAVSVATSYRTTISGAVYIPAYHDGLPVTEVAANGFTTCVNVESIVFLNGSLITKIGTNAFMNCLNLRSIEIPVCVTDIGQTAFAFCNKLNDIIIPQSVNYVAKWAFGYIMDYEAGPIFIHVRADRQKTQEWDSEWYFVGGSSLITYNSTHQFGDAQPAYYTVKYTASKGGEISGVQRQFVLAGENCFTVTANARIGYKFAGWSDGITTAERTDKNINSNLIVTANFEVDLIGEGTEANPYLINSYEDFLKIKSFRDSHFLLAVDLDLAGINHTPLFTDNDGFKGTFDGGCFTIKNLTILANKNSTFPSLFGILGIGGTIKNLNMTNVSIALPDLGSHSYVVMAGAVCGKSGGALVNIAVEGSIVGSNKQNYYGLSVGGIVGYAPFGYIKNCNADIKIALSDISASDEERSIGVGGIVGIINGNVINCHATGTINLTNCGNGLSFYNVYAGGLIGMVFVQSGIAVIDIADCTADVEITSYSISSCGGLIGWISSDKSTYNITNCHAKGDVISNCALTSGFLALFLVGNDSKIVNCSATGNISGLSSGGFIVYILGIYDNNFTFGIEIIGCYATGDVDAEESGGFCALATGSINFYRCYATGNVKSESYTGQGNGSAAGFINDSESIHVEECFSLGTVSGLNNVAGFIAKADNCIIKNCYSKSNVSFNRLAGTVYIGGLIGINYGNTEATNCYYSGKIVGNFSGYFIGALVGVSSGDGLKLTNCHWLYYSDSVAKKAYGLDTASVVADTYKYNSINEMHFLADMLNDNEADLVWINVDDRTPQLLFILS